MKPIFLIRFLAVVTLFSICTGFSANLYSQVINTGQSMKNILPMRERVQMTEKWWQKKVEQVLPAIMREQGVDMWIVRNDEADRYYNNEGPVYTSLLPANYEGMAYPSQYQRGQSTPDFMMFVHKGDRVEYIEPKDYAHVSQLVVEHNPSAIAIGSYNNERMLRALGPDYAAKAKDSWTLGVRWLETELPEQISVLRYVQSLANDIIAEGFSNATIIPGVTTTDDLNWWFRQKMLDLDLEYENHPSIGVQRKPANIEKYDDPAEYFSRGRSGNGQNVTIQRGDIISIDSDIYMLGLVTDSHQHVYILEEGETDVPKPLKKALITVNKMQDLYAKEFKLGRTGKEIVAAADKIRRPKEVVESSLGFHPPPKFIRRYLAGGYMFSTKTYVAGMTSGPGYYPSSIVTNNHKLALNSLYAFEPHTSIAVPGWGEHGVELGIGQIAVFTEDGLQYLDRPQKTQWHIVK